MAKPVLLCLHGWGGSKESFTELREALKDADIEILTPDLPGFGLEPEPARPWSVDDYATWTEKWLQKNVKVENGKLKNLHILGHSHGGRIAMKLVLRGNLPISHLYLCAAAGIRRPRHFRRILGLALAKTGKFFLSIPGIKLFQPVARRLLYKLVRVHDYEKASPIMRRTMIKVTREDCRQYLPRMRTPCDIFWGKEDRMTPLKDAVLLHTLLQNSKLHVFSMTRHRVHRDRAAEIAATIKARMGTP
jgi:pimeloyl-ACP methyl ester carboxylesterase